MHEVQRLKAAGYNGKAIAQKLGVEPSYIIGILQLLRKGEERLIARVEEGARRAGQIAANGGLAGEVTEPIRNIVGRAPLTTKRFVEDHKGLFS